VDKLASLIKGYCHSNFLNHGVHTFYALMTRLIDYSLDNPGSPAPKCAVYRQKCDAITLSLLLSLPGFVQYHQDAFFKYFQVYRGVENVEISDGRVKKVADVLSLSLYLRFSTADYRADIDNTWKAYIREGQKLLASLMSEHDGRQSVFVRMVCCRLLCFLGFITSEPESKDSPVCKWRDELVKVLDEFCNDTDSKIQAYAWAVDIEQPISLSDYSHLTPPVREKGYFA